MKTQKGILHLLPLLLVGILIIAVGVGMYWYGNKSGNPIVTKATPSPEETVTNIDTLNWKTEHIKQKTIQGELTTLEYKTPNDWIIEKYEKASDNPDCYDYFIQNKKTGSTLYLRPYCEQYAEIVPVESPDDKYIIENISGITITRWINERQSTYRYGNTTEDNIVSNAVGFFGVYFTAELDAKNKNDLSIADEIMKSFKII